VHGLQGVSFKIYHFAPLLRLSHIPPGVHSRSWGCQLLSSNGTFTTPELQMKYQPIQFSLVQETRNPP
jgi:hypothetical protein